MLIIPRLNVDLREYLVIKPSISGAQVPYGIVNSFIGYCLLDKPFKNNAVSPEYTILVYLIEFIKNSSSTPS